MLSISETRQVTLGQFLRQKRKSADLSQTQIAMKTGVSRISVLNYESDKREPTLSYIVKFAKAIHEKPSVMLSGFIDQAME